MAHRVLFRTTADADQVHTLGVEAAVLARGEETDSTFELLSAEFPSGFVLPPHRHPWAEWYAVIDGTLDVTIGRRTQTVEAGGFAYVPPNSVHVLATSAGTARAVLWTSGAEALAMFEDMAEHLPAGPPAPEIFGDLIEITARHGLEMMIPVG